MSVLFFPGLLFSFELFSFHVNLFRVWLITAGRRNMAILSTLKAIARPGLLCEMYLGWVRRFLLSGGLCVRFRFLVWLIRRLARAITQGCFQRSHLGLQLCKLFFQLVCVDGRGYSCSSFHVCVIRRIILNWKGIWLDFGLWEPKVLFHPAGLSSLAILLCA